MRMPDGIAKNSHGNIASAAIPEMSSASSVSRTASNGIAVRAIPSPRLLARLAVKRLANAPPSPLCGAADALMTCLFLESNPSISRYIAY